MLSSLLRFSVRSSTRFVYRSLSAVKMNEGTPRTTLKDLIARLRELFKSDNVNIEEVSTLMSSYKSRRGDWDKYAMFDAHKYTRNLVDAGNGKYNLILLCWGESQGTSIHSHADSHCFMTILDGQLKETHFDWPTEPEAEAEMECVRENVLGVGQTTYMSDKLGLHRVENLSHSNKAVSLHLYSPPFDECQCFDQQTGHRTKGKITFWSKFGQLCEGEADNYEETENKQS